MSNVYSYPDSESFFQQSKPMFGIHHLQHPLTQESIEVHVVKRTAYKSDIGIFVRPAHTPYEEPTRLFRRIGDSDKYVGTPNKIVEGTPAHQYGFSSIKALKKWYIEAKSKQSVIDSDGNIIALLEMSKGFSKKIYSLVVPKDSILYVEGAANKVVRSTKEDILHLAEQAKICANKLKRTYMAYSALKANGISPVSALEQDLLPKKVKSRPFISLMPNLGEDESIFINDLYVSVLPTLKLQAGYALSGKSLYIHKKDFIPYLVGNGTSIGTDCVAYKVLLHACNTYKPSLKTPFINFLGSSAYYLFKQYAGAYKQHLYSEACIVPRGFNVGQYIQNILDNNTPVLETPEDLLIEGEECCSDRFEAEKMNIWIENQIKLLDNWVLVDIRVKPVVESAKEEVKKVTSKFDQKHILDLLAVIAAQFYKKGSKEYNSFIINYLDQEGL